ncbi:MAG: hypothetical protein ACLVKO_10885 [Dysgonomonas sp.]
MSNSVLSITVLFAILIFWELNSKKPLDWTQTYINTDKVPYGTYIVFDQLKNVFEDKNVYVSRFPISNELDYVNEDESGDGYEYDEEFSNTSYIFINRSFGEEMWMSYANNGQNFEVDNLDIKNLFRFLREGNNVFIAAEYITPRLLDSLDIKMESVWAREDTVYTFNYLSKKEFSFPVVNHSQYAFNLDSCKSDLKVLAESKKQRRPVFLRIKYGTGNLYLNLLPVAFTNVEVLKPNKYDFAFACLSYLPKTDYIIWDEYLKQGRVGEDSSFRVIWNHPALLVAYYIALVGSLLFVLFRSKRTQRIIPVIEPPKNTSLEFLDTISNLYYHKQAYLSIMEKRQGYFLELVRNRYYLKTENINKEFISTLSLKSNVDVRVVEKIFSLYDEAQTAYDVSNGLLLRYNASLEEFYRNMK